MPMQSRSSIESAGAELVIGGGRTRAVPLLPLQWNPWTVAATVLVLLLAIPILVVVIGALSGGGETWRHLTSTVLPEHIRNSILLVICVGARTLPIGGPTAWPVAPTEFRGRSLLVS